MQARRRAASTAPPRREAGELLAEEPLVGRLLGRGTHGEVFAHATSPRSALKIFSRASAVRFAACRPSQDGEETTCVQGSESVCAATSREARIQALAASALRWAAEDSKLQEPPVVPAVESFDEGPRRCVLRMQRLFPPPGKKTKLVQLATAERSYESRNDQGHYLGEAQLRVYLKEAAPTTTLEHVVARVAFAYACFHFLVCADGYDVEFVLASFAPGGKAAVCALDFDKVSMLRPADPFPQCLCRKVGEDDFAAHRFADSSRLYRFLASAMNSSGAVPLRGALWEDFARAYRRYGNRFVERASVRRWPSGAPDAVLRALAALAA